MSFEKKYSDSIDIANYAYNENKYDAAVNRYYYGIYQKILHEINGDKDLLEEYNKVSANGSNNSHNNIIYLYAENILMKKLFGKERMKVRQNFNRYINDLKSLRRKADYKPELTTKYEADKAKKNYENLIRIINN